jgi:IS4 transposase
MNMSVLVVSMVTDGDLVMGEDLPRRNARSQVSAALQAKTVCVAARATADKLSRLHAREGATLCAVAYALRLSPKSRLNKSAATTARSVATEVRPWEDD